MSVRQDFLERLSSASGLSGDFFLFWKGRVALYALLHALGVGPGDEVILPAFTCVVVPNAIMYRGAVPIYADIDPDSMCPTPQTIGRLITRKTKCILCQNTFGLSAMIDEIVATARASGIATIEDCTHGFGGTYKSNPNGSHCDAAFFSSQWNKPFSTGVGGYAYTENPTIGSHLRSIGAQAIAPSFREFLSLRIMDFGRRHFVDSWSYWPLVNLYRWLGKIGLAVSSSNEDELQSPVMPKGYLKSMSQTQMRMGLRALASLDDLNKRRKTNASAYTKLLRNLGKRHVPAEYALDHLFLKYPIFVQNRQRFLECAVREKIALGDWFNSPLHPVQGDLGAWMFARREYPNAEYCSTHILNLPTDTMDLPHVLAFIEARRDDVL